jgi:hypothetical protein
MEYALVYSNTETYIRSYIIHLISLKINNNNITNNTVNTLTKILNNFSNYKFFKDEFICMILSKNNSNKEFIRLQKFFVKSLTTFIINKQIGLYLLKYYYYLYFIYFCYNQSLEFICKKIYEKSKQRANHLNKIKPYKLLYYNNIKNINHEIKKFSKFHNFSLNDDKNFTLVNNIFTQFYVDLKNFHYIKFDNFKIYYEQNIFLKLFKNINNLYKYNIK